MGWKVKDFECQSCGHLFEELVTDSEEVLCPRCGSQDVKGQFSAPNIGAFSAASPERQREILKTRSARHTEKEVAKEPERFGQAGIERQQANKNPQVGYTGK